MTTSRKEISKIVERKLEKWFSMTLDINKDGLVNWSDFEHAIEVMQQKIPFFTSTKVEKIVPISEAEKNARLKILRKRVEQNFQKYFWDLCEVGDANKDGNIDLEEWLDVMNDIIRHLKETKQFPEWYEGLHKALWRSHEFMDNRNVLKEEFADMLQTWSVDPAQAKKAFEFITENGKHKMNYELFSEFMKKFFLNETTGHPINLGLDR